ncbi:hypothetical protein Pst134EA_013795 [Puccinia striiformis f. sp. tritici]|uniref:hypothetical protein n=1 Tax=Puccinia striiformis f. sp. tritici TaxID=168172 RepID=UPI0020073C45|nr:hypothetical protein Pst134EA_013795 [Puccinia striiformis f. sp. tritici]KAH9465940.1 hypothetical protein Pst134EA_013795 [Puccinia striiformis f. sp. tritici]
MGQVKLPAFGMREKKPLAKKVPAEKDIKITKTRPGSSKATPNGSQQSIIPTSQQVITAIDTDQASPSESIDSKSSQSQNYCDGEDVQICKSWLEVSQDPLNSTNQAADTFWTRVAEQFTKVRDNNCCLWSSIKSRWQILQQWSTSSAVASNSAMKLFQAITIAENEQRVKKSKKAKKQPTKFTHMGCYHVLCHAQKWKDHCEELERKKIEEKKSLRLSSPLLDSGTGSQFTSDPLDNDQTSDAESVQSNQTVCAIGNKKAKEIAAKLREDKKFKEDMITVHRNLAKQTKAQNSILAVQQEAMTTLADNSVMQTDLATVPERSCPFYEWQQMKVPEKIQKEQADYEKKKKGRREKSKKRGEKQKKANR